MVDEDGELEMMKKKVKFLLNPNVLFLVLRWVVVDLRINISAHKVDPLSGGCVIGFYFAMSFHLKRIDVHRS